MYKSNKILCVVPARCGSKGLHNKNIKELAGKPLIAYTIEQANQSRHIDRVIVSSEDDEIIRIAKKCGAEVPFVRPEELATDESSTIDVLIHAINWMEEVDKYPFDILVLLHATAPLRSVEDIDNCIEVLVDKKCDNVFSVTEAHRNPYFNMVEVNKEKVVLSKGGDFVSRQSAPDVFDMNASIYVWWKEILKDKKNIFMGNTKIYLMPRERSIDIDDYLDFKIAEMLIRKSI